MSAQRVTVTGATGLVGLRLITALRARGALVTALTREPKRALARLDAGNGPALEVERWDPIAEPAPSAALAGRDAVVHLAGENVAQRWSARARRAIRESRVAGTRHLVEGLREADPRPQMLLSASAVGYYGAHGEEPLDEDVGPGSGFLADVCVDWEHEAARASQLGVRVVQLRTGVVLDRHGGALAKMLPAFRIGVGGPVGSGRQFISWIHPDDLVGIIRMAIGDERWSGAVNGTAPEPVSSRDFSRALGRELRRPAWLPVPAAALHLLFGEMAGVLTTGARAVPAKALVLGYEFAHPHVEDALAAALAE